MSNDQEVALPKPSPVLKAHIMKELNKYKTLDFTERLIRPVVINLNVHLSLLFVFISSKKQYGPCFYGVWSGSRLFTYAQY